MEVVEDDVVLELELSLLLVLLDDPLSDDEELELSLLLEPPESLLLDELLSEDELLSLLPPTGRFFVP